MPVVIDYSKPLLKMREIAGSLGWHGLELWRHTFDDRAPTHWYQTSDNKFMLWISEYPVGQDEVFIATVHADRYGICSGLHQFMLSDPKSIAALVPWIRRKLFRNPAWRRELRRTHPECCSHRPTPDRCTQMRVRREWPPYEAYEDKPDPPCEPTWH